jgi:Holliday junction resolvase RusA-like endonuclease
MYRLEVEGIPPSLNKFYSGMHWRVMQRHRDEWHTLFWISFKKAKLPKPLTTPITVSVTQYCKRLRDVDNAVISAKFCLDTLREHGYIPDDTPEYVNKVILECQKAKVDKTVILIQ